MTPTRAYTELDANRDGNLSAEEYAKLYPEAPYESLDSNSDGKVSDDEYKARMEKRKPTDGTSRD